MLHGSDKFSLARKVNKVSNSEIGDSEIGDSLICAIFLYPQGK
jgi:hypothetical protein